MPIEAEPPRAELPQPEQKPAPTQPEPKPTELPPPKAQAASELEEDKKGPVLMKSEVAILGSLPLEMGTIPYDVYNSDGGDPFSMACNEKYAFLLAKLNEILQSAKRIEGCVCPSTKNATLSRELREERRAIYERIKSKKGIKYADEIADYLVRISKGNSRNTACSILCSFAAVSQNPPTKDDFDAYFRKQTVQQTAKRRQSTIASFLIAKFEWDKASTQFRIAGLRPKQPVYVPERGIIELATERLANSRIPIEQELALFVWFCYASGQRLADALAAGAANYMEQVNENGTRLIGFVASKTGHNVYKMLPADLVSSLPSEGKFFQLRREVVQKGMRDVTSLLRLKVPLRIKNLRAAHISAHAAAVIVAKNAAAHTTSQPTLESYLDPKLMNTFNLIHCFPVICRQKRRVPDANWVIQGKRALEGSNMFFNSTVYLVGASPLAPLPTDKP